MANDKLMKLSKITPGTYGPHHADVLDFNVRVRLFEP